MELLRTLDLGLTMRFKCGSHFLWHWLERWKPQSIEKERSYRKETNILDQIHTPLKRSFWIEKYILEPNPRMNGFGFLFTTLKIRTSLKLANVLSEFQFPSGHFQDSQTFHHHFCRSEDDSTTQSFQRTRGYCHVSAVSWQKEKLGITVQLIWQFLPSGWRSNQDQNKNYKIGFKQWVCFLSENQQFLLNCFILYFYI